MLRLMLASCVILFGFGVSTAAEEPKPSLSVEWKTPQGESMKGKTQGWKFDQKERAIVLTVKTDGGETLQVPLKQLDKTTQDWFKNQWERLQAAERRLQQQAKQLNAQKRRANKQAQRARRAQKNNQKK